MKPSSYHPWSAGSRCRRLLTLTVYLLATASIYLLFKEPIHSRVTGLLEPFSFSGDALQHIAPMWFVRHPERIAHDYIQTYYLNAIFPLLFKGVYAVATLFTSPLGASKIITIILSALFVITTTATSKRLAGTIAAYLTALFATGGVVKNMYFMGGIQRSFGIWLASLALYFICSGRVIALGLTGVVAAMLYPAASIFILTAIALILLLPARLRGSASSWPLKKRMVFFGLCTLGCTLAVSPQLVGGSMYGPRLSLKDEAKYPEWGIGGRYTDGDRGVPLAFTTRVFSSAVSSLVASRVKARKHLPGKDDQPEEGLFDLPLSTEVSGVFAFTAVCAVWILYQLRGQVSAAALRCGVFALTMLVAFVGATLLFPLLYIPSRYVMLGCIPLVPVVFPCVWTSACTQVFRERLAALNSIFALVLGCSLFVWLGWLHPSVRGFPSASGHLPLFRFVRTLPADTIIAGWPRGIINQIPLFTARSVLLFEEGHQIFHRDCLEELRNRTRSLIALYAATDTAPLTELQTRYKVTHLLLDKRHLDKAPPYFAPFDAEMKAARVSVEGKTLILAELALTKAIYESGNFVLIDLNKAPLSP